MAVAQRSGRARYRLLLLILTAATLLTLDFRGFGPLETAQSRVRDVLEPVVSAVESVLGPVAEVWTVMFSYNDLRSENAALTEELDRLRAHIGAARDLLREGVAIGRRLDFLCQEFNREANTLAAKASVLTLTRIGLNLKTVIDRLREQAQNLE